MVVSLEVMSFWEWGSGSVTELICLLDCLVLTPNFGGVMDSIKQCSEQNKINMVLVMVPKTNDEFF